MKGRLDRGACLLPAGPKMGELEVSFRAAAACKQKLISLCRSPWRFPAHTSRPSDGSVKKCLASNQKKSRNFSSSLQTRNHPRWRQQASSLHDSQHLTVKNPLTCFEFKGQMFGLWCRQKNWWRITLSVLQRKTLLLEKLASDWEKKDKKRLH